MSEVFISKEQFNALYETNKGFVFLMELLENRFQYIYVNQAANIVFPTNPEGKFLSDCIQESRTNLIIENYMIAISTKQQIIYRDFYLFQEDGYTNETICTPIFYGNHTYILAITNNISDKKIVEEKNVFLQSLFQDRIDPTAILLEDLSIYEVNRIFNHVFDCNFDKNQNLMNCNFIDSENKIKYQTYIRETFKGRGSSAVIFSHIKKDGKMGDFLVSFSPVLIDEVVVAISIQWQEIKSPVQLKHDLIQQSLALQNYKYALNVAANICVTDANGVIQYVNKGFEKQTQYKQDELVGKTHAILSSRKQSREFYHDLWSHISNGEIWRGEMCDRTKYGRNFWTDTTIVPIKNAEGDITNFLGISFDISDKKMMMTKLKNSEKLFRLITNHTNDLIVITNEDGIIQYVSPVYEAVLGYVKEELFGKFFADILTPQSTAILTREFETNLSDFGHSKIELEVVSKDGQSFWLEAKVSAVKDEERKGIYQFVIVAREITERKELEENLRFLAYHDSLTMLPNRRYLMEKFEELANGANTTNSSIAILFIDGDNFKQINDKFGHEVGDEFISNFGKALSLSVRDSDLVVRIGGDEFIVLLTKMSLKNEKRKEQIEQAVKRIQKILRIGWEIRGQYFSPTSSIGIACYPENGTEISQLLDQADEALYLAKEISGKDSYHFARNN